MHHQMISNALFQENVAVPILIFPPACLLPGNQFLSDPDARRPQQLNYARMLLSNTNKNECVEIKRVCLREPRRRRAAGAPPIFRSLSACQRGNNFKCSPRTSM
jgi:hypothetical protein